MGEWSRSCGKDTSLPEGSQCCWVSVDGQGVLGNVGQPYGLCPTNTPTRECVSVCPTHHATALHGDSGLHTHPTGEEFSAWAQSQEPRAFRSSIGGSQAHILCNSVRQQGKGELAGEAGLLEKYAATMPVRVLSPELMPPRHPSLYLLKTTQWMQSTEQLSWLVTYEGSLRCCGCSWVTASSLPTSGRQLNPWKALAQHRCTSS